MATRSSSRFASRTLALALALAGPASPVPLTAQDSAPTVDLSAATAEDLLNRGRSSFGAGDYAACEAAIARFLDLYGESAEAAEALPRLLPLLAVSRIQQRNFTGALPVIERFLAEVEDPEPQWEEEMMFWRGVCQMQAEDFETAERSLAAFIDNHPESPKSQEAILLVATCGSLRGAFPETHAYLARTKEDLAPFNRGRATVLQLNALVQAADWDAARELVMREFPRMDEMIQIVAFQTLALEVGSHFLDAREFRKAVGCLQRVWTKDRLLRHQRARLTSLRDRLEVARERAIRPFEMLTLAQLIRKVEREIEGFQTIEHFDSALRLRIATAYLGMERFREAALILEDMLARMHPDPIVEQASLNLVKCWTAIERWPKAAEAADSFATKFPDSEFLPLILFMKGDALRNNRQYAEAAEVFETVAADYPNAPIAARALFMKGFSELLAEDNASAIATLASVPERFPESHEVIEMAHYWRGMGHSFQKDHETCRKVMREYLDRHPEGKHRGEATFRIAYCAQSLGEFETAISLFRGFLDSHARHERADEARLLLGEALMATGEIDKGIVALQGVSDRTPKFFEEAQFKIAKAFRLQEKHERLAEHMTRFVDNHPLSPRVPEAVYWIGWTHRMANDPDKARAVYWSTIRELGAESRRRSVTDLFQGLSKLYAEADATDEYLDELRTLTTTALGNGQNALALRGLWAQAQALERSDPESARAKLIAASRLIDPPTTNPAMLADIGDALREDGQLDAARTVYADLRKWNPRSTQKDRAFAGLGLIAVARDDPDEALRQFERFERETLGSPLLPDILLAKARLLADRGEPDGAQAAIERLLAEETVAKAQKAEALLTMGDLHMQAGNPARAVPFYQRVYIMYGRWADLVARSYVRSGQAFEQLERTEEAIKTYEEMLAREDLSEHAEAETARRRLNALRPPGDALRPPGDEA